MLFHSSIRRELARSFGATLVVLATIVMTMMLIRTLGQASRGVVNPSEVLLILGFTVLGYLPTLLSLSLFISIVATLSRMYADREMVIWFSSGQGSLRFLTPLLRFAWPVLLMIPVLSLLIWPWSNQQIRELRDRYERRGDIERIAPGQFQESADGNRVFFVDKESTDGQWGSNVFIAARERGTHSVTSARSARIEIVDGRRILILNKGQRLEMDQSVNRDRPIKLSEFEEYRTVIDEKRLAPLQELPARSRSTLRLLREPTPENQGELGWRIGLIFSALNLLMLALAVANVNPRAGRSGSLVFALFAFVVYYNLLNLGQSWVAAGQVTLLAWLIGLHGGVLAVAMAWLIARHQGWSWRSWLSRRPHHREASV